jgi:hypothetical protein
MHRGVIVQKPFVTHENILQVILQDTVGANRTCDIRMAA